MNKLLKFCTAVNCIDGRIQLPVIEYLQKRFNAEYVDCITEAGPNLILSERKETQRVEAILQGVQISVKKHNSVGISVAGHHDCAGYPAPKDEQIAHTKEAVESLKERYPNMEIIGLWVDESWKVSEVGKI